MDSNEAIEPVFVDLVLGAIGRYGDTDKPPPSAHVL